MTFIYAALILLFDESTVPDLCTATSSSLSSLVLLQTSSPGQPRCCSTAVWLNLTLRPTHKQLVKRSELQTVRRSSAGSLPEASVWSTCRRPKLSRMQEGKASRGLGDVVQDRNVCEDYSSEVQLQRSPDISDDSPRRSRRWRNC